MYTPQMRESIRMVERTRGKRLEEEEYPTLQPDEKERLLRDYHPDYREDTQREVRVGPNAGDKMPHELVDCLEGRSELDYEAVSLQNPDIDTEVLVIGGGGAGTAAALTAQSEGLEVLLVTKLRLGDANTMMAQGGIQAADKPSDSPVQHYLDVIGGGGFTNEPQLVEALVRDAPYIIKWLEELGCMFSKSDDGTMLTIHGGGTSRKRMHFARDYTGAEIMRTIRDEVINRSLPTVEFCAVLELLMDEEGRCAGAVVRNLDTGEVSTIRARATVLATGGFGRLHVAGFPTTNHYGATGDGLVMAYKAGARLTFMDAVQYHPTGVAFPEQMLGQLVTEKVRGLGAQLVNSQGEQFVYPLETRDAVSSAIIRECDKGGGFVTPTDQAGVWLDSPMIDEINGDGTVRRELPAMVRQFERFDIDMTADPILVYPTLHYQNGGIEIDEHARSLQIPNLYVAGEAAGGIHGRNRLMGNSLLDILVFGRRAALHASKVVDQIDVAPLTLQHVREYDETLKEADVEGRQRSPMVLPDYVSSK